MEKTGRNICIFGASGNNIAQKHFEAAHNLGSLLAQSGFGCINGAGRSGLMKAVADGVIDEGGTAIGVIPQFMVDRGWHYERMTKLVVTPDMHTRKQTMAEMSIAAVALPGGCGTLEELLEVITWKQLGIYDKPIVILNTDGFYDPLLAMLERCIDQGFMKKSHSTLWSVALTPSDVVEQIVNYHPQEVECKY